MCTSSSSSPHLDVRNWHEFPKRSWPRSPYPNKHLPSEQPSPKSLLHRNYPKALNSSGEMNLLRSCWSDSWPIFCATGIRGTPPTRKKHPYLVILVAATVEAPNHETTSSPQSTPASLWKYAATGQCHTPLWSSLAPSVGDTPLSATPRANVKPSSTKKSRGQL